jgi:hypothetical protein
VVSRVCCCYVRTAKDGCVLISLIISDATRATPICPKYEIVKNDALKAAERGRTEFRIILLNFLAAQSTFQRGDFSCFGLHPPSELATRNFLIALRLEVISQEIARENSAHRIVNLVGKKLKKILVHNFLQ